MTVTIIVVFVAYMLCCIADGPDVKPIIKKRLGKYLEVQANRLHPIQYVRPIVHPGYESRLENSVMFDEMEQMQTMRRRGCTPEQAVEAIYKDAEVSLARSFVPTLLKGGFIKFDHYKDFKGDLIVVASLHVTKY